jgi:hypothetical protein
MAAFFWAMGAVNNTVNPATPSSDFSHHAFVDIFDGFG